MPSKTATELATKIVTAGMSATGTHFGGEGGTFAKILAAQIDVAAEIAQEGSKMNRTKLVIVLAQKLLSVSDALPNDTLQCVGSISSLGLGLASVAMFPPAGVAGAFATGLGTLAELYGGISDCQGPVTRAIAPVRNRLENLRLKFLTRFQVEFWDWVRANGGMAPPA